MYYSILPTARGPSAFHYLDPEGAPAHSGARFHAALDWFAPGGTVLRAPANGRVVEVRSSRGRAGQVFGGVVKLQTANGWVFVFRHVDPGPIRMGEVARAGLALAKVTDWIDGADHCHLEVWRSLSGGYRVENMIDPADLDWGPYLTNPVPDALPVPPYSDTLRVVLGDKQWAGWPECAGPLKWIAAHGVRLSQERAAIAWRDSVWRGPKRVTNVARRLVRDHLTKEA